MKNLMKKNDVIDQIKIKFHWLFIDTGLKSYEEKISDLMTLEEWAVSENILTWAEVEETEQSA